MVTSSQAAGRGRTGGVEGRVAKAAQGALDEKGYVAPIDVLVRMGWLEPVRVDEWRQGRVPALERVVQVNLHKLSTAMATLRRWGRERGLQPSETDYVARTRDRRRLQFSVSGDPAIEKAYRTHWVSPALSEAKRQRLAEKQSRPPDLVVINAVNEWSCAECGGTGDLLIMEEPGPLCMSCADLDHLVFLPSGDPALTRRAKKASGLSAVVVRFSRPRKRYERQGILVSSRHWKRPSPSAWPTRRLERGVVAGTRYGPRCAPGLGPRSVRRRPSAASHSGFRYGGLRPQLRVSRPVATASGRRRCGQLARSLDAPRGRRWLWLAPADTPGRTPGSHGRNLPGSRDLPRRGVDRVLEEWSAG